MDPQNQSQVGSSKRALFRVSRFVLLIFLCGVCFAELWSTYFSTHRSKVRIDFIIRNQSKSFPELLFNPGMYFTPFGSRAPFPADWILISAHVDHRFEKLQNNQRQTAITIVGAGPSNVIEHGIDLTAHLFSFQNITHLHKYSFVASFPCLRTQSNIFDSIKSYRGNIAIICTTGIYYMCF